MIVYDSHREFLTVPLPHLCGHGYGCLHSGSSTSWMRIISKIIIAMYCTGREMCAVYVSWLGWGFDRSASIDMFFFDEPPKAAEGLLRSSLGKMSEETPLKSSHWLYKKAPFTNFFLKFNVNLRVTIPLYPYHHLHSRLSCFHAPPIIPSLQTPLKPWSFISATPWCRTACMAGQKGLSASEFPHEKISLLSERESEKCTQIVYHICRYICGMYMFSIGVHMYLKTYMI